MLKALVLLAATSILVMSCRGKSMEQNTLSATDSLSGTVWPFSGFVIPTVDKEAKEIFTKMNEAFANGSLKLGLQSNIGTADVGWRTPRIDPDSIKTQFEDDLVVTRLRMVLPYRWKNNLPFAQREKTREFHIDIVSKSDFRIVQGEVVMTDRGGSASDIKGGNQHHRNQINFAVDVLKFFSVDVSSKLSGKLKGFIEENSGDPMAFSPDLNCRVENNQVVYE